MSWSNASAKVVYVIALSLNEPFAGHSLTFAEL